MYILRKHQLTDTKMFLAYDFTYPTLKLTQVFCRLGYSHNSYCIRLQKYYNWSK